MLQVTPEQLQALSYERRITRWISEECPTCDYKIHYKFSGEDNNTVQFDPGCTCSDIETFRPKYVNSSWKEVAEYINGQQDMEKIKQIKEFWNL